MAPTDTGGPFIFAAVLVHTSGTVYLLDYLLLCFYLHSSQALPRLTAALHPPFDVVHVYGTANRSWLSFQQRPALCFYSFPLCLSCPVVYASLSPSVYLHAPPFSKVLPSPLAHPLPSSPSISPPAGYVVYAGGICSSILVNRPSTLRPPARHKPHIQLRCLH